MQSTTYQVPVWAQTLFAALLGWVLGVALQLQQVALWSTAIYTSIVVLALVLYAFVAIKNVARKSPTRVGQQACVLLALAALGFATTGLRSVMYDSDSLAPALEGRDVLVTGVVASLPQRNEAALRFRLQVESAQLAGLPVRVPPRMDVGWYGGAFPAGPGAALGSDVSQPAMSMLALHRPPPALQAGERWQMTLRLKAPHGARNPGGFDYELWLWEQGVQATGYVRAGVKDVAPVRLGATWQYPVAWARQTVRGAIYARIENRQQAGLIAALVVGDQAAIDRADWDVFRATGVAHLVSISGLHITLLAWVAGRVAGWLWRRSGRLCRALPAPHAALLLGVLVAVAYSAFAGWGVPAQRTCLMLITVGVLRLSAARWPWPQVWILACAVVVASDPWALLQAGFWLSFVAVGVLFATDLGATHLYSTGASTAFDSKILLQPPVRAARRVVATVARAAAGVQANWREQWVITVALAPLTLLLFGQVSVVGLLANAVAIPWLTLVITPLAMLGVVVPALWDVAALAVSGLLLLLQWLASWPWATLSVAVAPLPVALLGALGGVLLVAPLPPALRVLGLPLLLPVLLWQAPRPPHGEFEMLAADIGQGNAVIVRTASHTLVYDTGPRFSQESDAGHRVLVPLLRALGLTVDTVMLSHRDLDHVGGALAVLTMQPQAALVSSIEAGHELQRVRLAKRCEAGQRWVWDGVTFEVLHPRAEDYAVAQKPNALSCVLRIASQAVGLTASSRVALLAGDIESPQEARLVADGAPLRADVLLVPHHGSKTSSSAVFLDAVQPRVALIQAGYRNRFGHPVAPVLDRYRERGVQVETSPHCGAATWRSDQPLETGCHRVLAARYWHHQMP